MRTNRIKIIDLFAGIGGIRLGFEKASNFNIDCVFTSEWNKYSVQRHPPRSDDLIIHGDLPQLKESLILMREQHLMQVPHLI